MPGDQLRTRLADSRADAQTTAPPSSRRPKVGLISNPASGHNRDRFAAVAAMLDACPGLEHRVTRHADEVPAALRALAASGIDYLAINGGDGTASATLGCAVEQGPFATLPPVILLPGGTANMNAGDIGLGGGLTAAAGRLRAWCAQGCPPPANAQRRRLLRVTGRDGILRHGMFLGAGAVMQGTRYAHKALHSRGLRDDFSLALGTARTVWGVVRNDPRFNQAAPLELRLDRGEPRRHEALVLAVSTLHRLAFGMRPFWGRGDGPLRLTLLEAGCSRMARTFLSIIRGKPSAHARPEHGYFSHNAHRLDLSLGGQLNLDGEIIAADGPLTIETTQAVEFCKP